MENIKRINRTFQPSSITKMILSLLLALMSHSSFAQNILRQAVYSTKMNKNINVVVISPPFEKGVNYKTIYILHGYSGNAERTYQKDLPDLVKKAEMYQTIYVLADGNYNSWYVDSPIDATSQYQTFIGEELVAFIDANYPTLPNKENRGILGWSMGGFGALHIGIAHPTTFSIVGSSCGAINLVAFEKEYADYQIDKVLGKREDVPLKYQLLGNEDQMKNTGQYYILDCGTEDTQMIQMNRTFHHQLTAKTIEHSYTEYKGEHNTAYWSKALTIQLALFDTFFQK